MKLQADGGRLLVANLAEFRRGCGDVVATELRLGPWQSARVDVVAMRPSWTRPCPTVWEVKVSRGDFLADVREGKYRKYLPFCERLYFAAPAGLIQPQEVPEGCGLQVLGDRGWYTVKAPRLRPVGEPEFLTLTMALLFRDHPSPWRWTEEGAVQQTQSLVDRGRMLDGFGNLRFAKVKLSHGLRELANRCRGLCADGPTTSVPCDRSV